MTRHNSDIRVMPGEGTFDANGIGIVRPSERAKRSVHGFDEVDPYRKLNEKRKRQPVTRYIVIDGKRRVLDDTARYDKRRKRFVEAGKVHTAPAPSHAERMMAAQRRGLNPDALGVHAAGWDQDNS
jgi:hypothetical protein